MLDGHFQGRCLNLSTQPLLHSIVLPMEKVSHSLSCSLEVLGFFPSVKTDMRQQAVSTFLVREEGPEPSEGGEQHRTIFCAKTMWGKAVATG